MLLTGDVIFLFTIVVIDCCQTWHSSGAGEQFDHLGKPFVDSVPLMSIMALLNCQGSVCQLERLSKTTAG